MIICDWTTSGGKNVIMDYISSLPEKQKLELLVARERIREDGVLALETLNTRQLRGKLYEIKASQNRVMYVLKDTNAIYFLHACKKQKGKAEKKDIEKALKRAKALGLMK